MFTRRGFLFLLGAGTGAAGLLVASRGLFTIPDRFVLDHAGACSFCRKDAAETQALAGIAGCRSRICDECVGLCFDIIAEESTSERAAGAAAGGSDRREPLSPKQLAELEQMFANPPSFGSKAFHCNFCGHSRHEVRKLVSGPRVFICDGCVEDAWALMRSV